MASQSQILAGLTSPDRDVVSERLGDELLEREVRDFMTPGCLTISEEASVAQAAEALAAHRIHAVLVVGAKNGAAEGVLTDFDLAVAAAR